MTQRHWEDVVAGESIEPVAFPLTVYRLVMAAGANRDFNAIHHNAEFARATGAPDMYANTLLLQGMWECAVRRFIGLAGVIVRQSGFQMRVFNCPRRYGDGSRTRRDDVERRRDRVRGDRDLVGELAWHFRRPRRRARDVTGGERH
jgi:acyl dehydratase